MSQESEIAIRVEKLLSGPISALGILLLDVDYRFEGRWILRLTIDREQGVTLDDCGNVSELAGRVLDVEDHVPNEFSLEVTSPGVFRPLREEKHYRQSLGKMARINLVAEAFPDLKTRTLRGTIKDVREGIVVLDVANESFELPVVAIASAKLDPDL